MPQPPFHNALGSPFIELESVDSTNNYAHTLIKAARLPNRQAQPNDSLLHGTAVFAHEQMAGKGQRGKIWNSEKDSNIILSVIVEPELLKLSGQFQLSVCVAVTLRDFFAKYAGEETTIKWPNDLYWQDRKAGGILIESIVGSRESVGNNFLLDWQWSIIGMGININQASFPNYLSNPVSLKQITGKNFDTVLMAKEICGDLNEKIKEFQTEGFEKIFADYLKHLYKINSLVKFRKANRLFEGLVKGVSPAGKLIVLHAIEEEFDFGELEWVVK